METYLIVSETVFNFFFSRRPAHGIDMFRKEQQARRSTKYRQDSDLFVVTANAVMEGLP